MKKGTIAILSTIVGAVFGATAGYRFTAKQQEEDKVYKFKSYYNMLNQWLMLKQQGKTLEEYFINNGYQTIAIYGMGEMGDRLYEELKDTSIQVKYAIDKNAECIFNELEVYEMGEGLEKVDAVVVTAIFAFESIEEQLSKIQPFKVISLEDVVFEI